MGERGISASACSELGGLELLLLLSLRFREDRCELLLSLLLLPDDDDEEEEIADEGVAAAEVEPVPEPALAEARVVAGACRAFEARARVVRPEEEGLLSLVSLAALLRRSLLDDAEADADPDADPDTGAGSLLSSPSLPCLA